MLRRDSVFLSIVEEEYQHQVTECGRFSNIYVISVFRPLQIEQHVLPHFLPIDEAKGAHKTTTTTKTKEVHGNLIRVN